MSVRQSAPRKAPWVAEGDRYRMPQTTDRSLRQQVASSLRDAILSGSLKPGERLVEEDISQGMHTSRGPLREALRLLEQEGLVMSVPYRGSFVSRISALEVREVLIPLRATLEGFGFSHAIDNLTDADISDLRAILAQMTEAGRAGDVKGIVETDVAFHGRVMSRSGQAHTMQIWGTIAPRMRAYIYTHLRDTMPTAQELEHFPAEHRELLDALISRDRKQVAALLAEHVQNPPGLPDPPEEA